ncbi:antibiotic biosynthesis monooxygenase [Actinoplanes sp. M2I2]|uniref:antibiotic biosynthesis monooxygenase family protein n=1 Tax=Actinoplanes sp. M2I2 TaxID=1734444 RepID=UPI0020212369|nr:antibiotic biosynthesis monooxygenase family protein [Actinoplanes sp. M2I2]
MVLEVALIDVIPGSEEGFAAAYKIAHPILATTPGCLSVRMTRGVESPSRFVLLVEWESLEAHSENFRNSERFPRWRGLIGEFFAKPPLVEHYLDVPAGDRPGPEHNFTTE